AGDWKFGRPVRVRSSRGRRRFAAGTHSPLDGPLTRSSSANGEGGRRRQRVAPFASLTAIPRGGKGGRHHRQRLGERRQLRCDEGGGRADQAGDMGGASIWYAWTPLGTPGSNLIASIDTAGSRGGPLLAVYTGSTVSGLTPVASNDDDEQPGSSRVCFSITPSTTYMIAVDGYAGDSGTITLNYGQKSDAAPCPVSPPTISGPASPKVGDTLVANYGPFVWGTALPTPPGTATPAVTWQWESCVEQLCADIGGATSPSYVVLQHDVGTAIRVSRRLTSVDGTAQNESAPTAVVSQATATHPNGRIFWVTKLPTSPDTFRIDS